VLITARSILEGREVDNSPQSVCKYRHCVSNHQLQSLKHPCFLNGEAGHDFVRLTIRRVVKCSPRRNRNPNGLTIPMLNKDFLTMLLLRTRSLVAHLGCILGQYLRRIYCGQSCEISVPPIRSLMGSSSYCRSRPVQTGGPGKHVERELINSISRTALHMFCRHKHLVEGACLG
jgi:hypothetical protein